MTPLSRWFTGNSISSTLVLAAIVLNTAACSKMAFSASDSLGTSVFSNTPLDTTPSTAIQPWLPNAPAVSTSDTSIAPSGSSTSSSSTTPSGLPTPLGSLNNDGTTPVELVCTGKMDRRQPEKLAVTSNASLQILVNGDVCSSDTATIKKQISAHTLNLNELCPQLRGRAIASIELKVNGVSNTVLNSSDQFIGEDSLQSMAGLKKLAIYYADPHSSDPAIAVDQSCQVNVDPLVVHVGKSRSESISLGDPAKGVMFDLLGAANNHKPVRISRFLNSNYGLLSLPSVTGAVSGIDELFGDHTVGPDGKTANDGYAALAKYDRNGDGEINALDPVFNHLRVWVDSNHDGIAQKSELMTLAEAEIASIHLSYTTVYSETDIFGNIANRKSFAERTDGTKEVMFDLWFRYLNE